MNCVVSCVAKVLDIKNQDVYTGIGHSEPIHIAEVIAYLLTRGYGAVFREKVDPQLSEYSYLVEGYQADNTPHMIVHIAGQGIYDPNPKPGFTSELFWYLIPTEINQEYCKSFVTRRDSWISAALKDARIES